MEEIRAAGELEEKERDKAAKNAKKGRKKGNNKIGQLHQSKSMNKNHEEKETYQLRCKKGISLVLEHNNRSNERLFG